MVSDPTVFSKKLAPEDHDRIVKKIIISGSPVRLDDPTSVLHWTVYLQFEDPNTSATLDMSPGGGIDGMTGTLLVESLGHGHSLHSAAAFSLDPLQDIGVDSYVSVIKALGRTRFRYSPEGRGCRWWCENIISDLENSGIVESKSLERFQEFVAKCSKGNPLRFPMPTYPGSFY